MSFSTTLERSQFEDWPQSIETVELVQSHTDHGGFIYESTIPTGSAETIPIENFLTYFCALGARIPNPSKVRDYLSRYPDIAELSRFVSDSVYRHFDFKTQLSLEIHSEDDPNSEYLALFLRVQDYDGSVMDRIDRIQESYYDLLNGMTGWFLFTTDFCSPR